VRRLVRLLALDAALLAAVAIGTALSMERAEALLETRFGVGAPAARIAIVAGATALCLPLVAGVVRVARRLGLVLAESALPAAAAGKADLAAAPRRTLVVTLQLASVLLTGLPLLALTQPVLGGVVAPALLATLLAAFAVSLWRGTADLQGHVRAGAQTIVEALVGQARRGRGGAPPAGPGSSAGAAAALAHVARILPGLGDPVPLELPAGSAAVGRTLAELDLRGITGATVLAIARGEAGILVPSAKEVLRAGDILALAGSLESIAAARALLAQPRAGDAAARPDDATPRSARTSARDVGQND
jgi:CPA2 family monovalent cation:H+ antiporter-2